VAFQNSTQKTPANEPARNTVVGVLSLSKLSRAVLPLVVSLSVFAPMAARADAADEVLSFFGKAAKAVKTQVIALPGQLGIRLVDSKSQAIAETIPVAPAAVIRPEAPTFTAQPDLSQIQTPVATAALVALPEPSVEKPAHRLYCAEYVRRQKGLPVFGDAKYWWDKARDLMTASPCRWRIR